MCAQPCCKPRPKASAAEVHGAAAPSAPLQLSGVTLTSRENDTITLTAHIDGAWGDAHTLHLTGVCLQTPQGMQMRTSEALWDVAEHAIEAPQTVAVQHPRGRLTAPAATLDARTGALKLQGPVTGDLDAPAGP